MSNRTFYASTYVVADGATRTWPFSFAGVNTGQESGVTPYLYPEDVKVQEIYTDADGNRQTVQRTGVLNAPNQITIDGPAIIAGREIRIYRETELRFPLVDYRDLQSVSEHDLDLANRQAVFVAQETRDTASANLVYDKQGHFDAGDRRIVNLAAGVDPKDAVNMEQYNRTLRVPEPHGIPMLPPAEWRARKLLTFDKNGNPEMVIPAPSSSIDLELRMRDPAISVDLLGWDYPVGSPLIYGIRGVLSQGSISLWEERFSKLCVKPDPNNPKTWDWQPAYQGAVDYLVNLARVRKSTYGLPALRVIGMEYIFMKGVTQPPWVKTFFEGYSIFNFSKSPVGAGNHITIEATDLVVPASNFSYAAPCFDAIGGGILIQGHGLTESRSVGVFAGNAVAGKSISREIGLINVAIWNCHRALEFGKYGSYLFHARNCRFENNFINIVTPEGTISNSGERMVFDVCIFGGGGRDSSCVLHRCDTFDIFFTTCSFDFNHDVLRMDAGCTYCAINFMSCHFEGWDGYLVHWRSSGANVYVTFTSCTILPTTYRLPKPLVLNSPSRTLVLFDGGKFSRCDVTFNDPIIRNTYLPWTEDPFISRDTQPSTDPASRRVVHINGYKPYAFSIHGSPDTVSNMDFDFQKDAAGTLDKSMTCWENAQTVPTNVTDIKVEMDGDKKVLAMVGTNVANHYFLRSKQRYPVMPGQTVFTWTALSLKALTMPPEAHKDLPNVQLGVEYEYADGSRVRSPFTSHNMGRQFNDAQMPNFAEGVDRYMSSGSFGIIVPRGVVAVRTYTGYTNFVGKLLISRVGMWIQ